MNDRLDKMLDDALASYGEAPANDGLEGRVLARVASEARAARSINPLLWVAAASLIIVLASLTWRSTQRPAALVSPVGVAEVTPKNEALPLRAAAPQVVAKARRRPGKRAAPKLTQFPTPSPMTDEERALVHLVNATPEHIPHELTDLGAPIKPVEIAAVHIKPLELQGNTKESKCCE